MSSKIRPVYKNFRYKFQNKRQHVCLMTLKSTIESQKKNSDKGTDHLTLYKEKTSG